MWSIVAKTVSQSADVEARCVSQPTLMRQLHTERDAACKGSCLQARALSQVPLLHHVFNASNQDFCGGSAVEAIFLLGTL